MIHAHVAAAKNTRNAAEEMHKTTKKDQKGPFFITKTKSELYQITFLQILLAKLANTALLTPWFSSATALSAMKNQTVMRP